MDADTASGTAPGADNKEDTTKGEEGEDDSHSKTNGGESEKSEKNEEDPEPSANSTSELAIEANGAEQSEKMSEKDKASDNGAAPSLSLADPATVESAKSSNGDENVPGEYAFVSSFIMGLSFQKGSRFIDIEPPIKVCTIFALISVLFTTIYSFLLFMPCRNLTTKFGYGAEKRTQWI